MVFLVVLLLFIENGVLDGGKLFLIPVLAIAFFYNSDSSSYGTYIITL